MWRRVAIAMPYIWLLVFFLTPFVIILKISLADPALAQPPYTPTIDNLGNFNITFDNFWGQQGVNNCIFRNRVRGTGTDRRTDPDKRNRCLLRWCGFRSSQSASDHCASTYPLQR